MNLHETKENIKDEENEYKSGSGITNPNNEGVPKS